MKLQEKIYKLNARLSGRAIVYKGKPFIFGRKQYNTHNYTFLDVSVCSQYDHSGHLVSKNCSIVLRLAVSNNPYIPDLVRNLKFPVVEADAILGYFEDIAKDGEYDVDYDLVGVAEVLGGKNVT